MVYFPAQETITHKLSGLIPSERVQNSQNVCKFRKGPFKYYVIKEVGGCGGQMMMFDDKVGGWGWLNDDVNKKYIRKKNFVCMRISLISLIQTTESFFL